MIMDPVELGGHFLRQYQALGGWTVALNDVG